MGKQEGSYLNLLKKNWNWIILVLILVLGFWLRSYHIDYPVIGYHNMKEAHTLGEAWFMYNEGDYFVNKLIYTIDSDNPQGGHMDNLPFLSWIYVILWKIFGVELWVARLIIILFSIGSVFFVYLLVKELFGREDFALLSAFLVAICPLLIFFGRNVQYDMPALFFMLGSAYFFMKWRKQATTKNLVLFSLFFALAGLSKLPFMIILIPILAIFPYKRLDFRKEPIRKKYLKQYLLGFVLLLVIPLFRLYSQYLDRFYPGHVMKAFPLDELSRLLTVGFWKSVYAYATIDNFTTLGVFLALLGLVFVILKIKKWNYRFLAFWFFSYLFYAASAPAQMTGHNYYQIPYAPLIMILVAYTLLLIFNTLLSFVKLKPKILKNLAVFGCIFVVLVVWYPALRLSTTRQFDTQFFGIDIAGEYVNEHSLPTELIFESGHQDRGIAWHAKRRLFDRSDVENLKRAEQELNVSWVFVYQWGFEMLQDPDMKEYIETHYSLAQFGFMNTPNGAQSYYLLLKKGGSFNQSNLNQILANRPVQSENYELTGGRQVMFNYINVI